MRVKLTIRRDDGTREELEFDATEAVVQTYGPVLITANHCEVVFVDAGEA